VNLLLDSHAAIWWATGSGDLTAATTRTIDGAATVSISLATPWELQIKVSTGKFDLGGADWVEMEERGVAILLPTLDDVLFAANLPLHHRDPFDRLIIAQAMRRGMVIVTRDRIFSRYGVPVIAA
jgi:PIN domain nuclease of toxin-antitoxin system